MENNIIQIMLEYRFVNAEKVWQYDYGKILRMKGENLPGTAEVHFSLSETSGDSITKVGIVTNETIEVQVPDTMLENNGTPFDYNIYAFVYVEDGVSGNTVYRIRIPVKARPKPSDHVTPDNTGADPFGDAVKAVNDAAERAKTSERKAKASEDAAAESAQKIADSATELNAATKEALKSIEDKKAESVSTIEKQKESSVQNVTEHTDSEIQRMTQRVDEVDASLGESIAEATAKKSALDKSVSASVEVKRLLDASVEIGKKQKNDLNGSVTAANASKSALDETVGQAKTLDASLSGKIAEGTQLNKDITASGQKAVNDINSASTKAIGDINSAGAAKLDAVNKAAEAIVADREQIAKNKTDITSLNEDLAQIENSVVGKNLLNPNTVTIGKRIYIDGSVHTQESDFYTDFIAVKPNQHIYASFLDPNGNFVRSQIRHVCAYDASETVLPSKGQSDIRYDYLVPDGVAYIAVTFTENNNINHRQLEVSDTGITSFEEYFTPYIELKAQAQIDKNTSGVKRLNEEKANGKGISFSINESGGLRVTYDDGK